jgi:hypothetical protein
MGARNGHSRAQASRCQCAYSGPLATNLVHVGVAREISSAQARSMGRLLPCT